MTLEAQQTDATTALTISTEADLIQVRQVLRAHADRIGLGLVDQTKLVTAGSELARNILSYATGSRGALCVEIVRAKGRSGVKATFTDDGPGIEDLQLALTDGYSTSRSLGLGLPGARRLVEEMTIESASGSGTTVVIIKWSR
jgi:serine/threonine-protein kinase RsbT